MLPPLVGEGWGGGIQEVLYVTQTSIYTATPADSCTSNATVTNPSGSQTLASIARQTTGGQISPPAAD